MIDFTEPELCLIRMLADSAFIKSTAGERLFSTLSASESAEHFRVISGKISAEFTSQGKER